MRTIRLIRSTTFYMALSAVAIQGSSTTAHADALEGAIYKETYRGEEVFPTSPDVARFQLDGMVSVVRGGDPFQSGPELTGASASARVTSVGGFAFDNEVAGTGVLIGNLLDRGEPVSATGHVDNFRVNALSNGSSIVGIGATGLTAVVLSGPAGEFVSASVFEFHGAAGRFPSLNIAEFDGSTLLSYQTIRLPVAVEGVPFEITLVVDPSERTAVARLWIEETEFETPAIALSAYTGQQPQAISHLVGVANRSGAFDLGAGDTASADLHGFCLSGLKDGGNVCRRREGP